MERRAFLAATATIAAAAMAPGLTLAAEQAFVLPRPDQGGGKPLLDALKARRSDRSFLPDPLPLPTLSTLLWAAYGINRPDSNRRTAPSCRNWQEIDIYAVLPEGAFRYDPKPHALTRASSEDLRKMTGKQDFVATAPLNLVYIADAAKMPINSAEERNFYAAVDTGVIIQNAYLFCASAGLATVARASIDREPLAKALNLRPEQWITMSQTVGKPRR
jgi:SagB-type dehydrogenase family enzyme